MPCFLNLVLHYLILSYLISSFWSSACQLGSGVGMTSNIQEVILMCDSTQNGGCTMLFADRVLLCRGYSISVPNAWGETISKPQGLILGLVYNPSRLQLTRQSLHSIAKWEWHGQRCQPKRALQVMDRWVGCRSAVCRGCGWVGRERGGVLKVLAVEQTSS